MYNVPLNYPNNRPGVDMINMPPPPPPPFGPEHFGPEFEGGF